jgi:hypothetical protein
MAKIRILFLLVFTSCATTTQLSKFAGNNSLTSMKTARIFVLRPSMYGSAIKMKVFCNDKLIGNTGPKSYLCWEVNEGECVIQSNSENKDYFTINAKAGKSYYIKQTPKMGVVTARVFLEQLQETEGKALVEKLKKPKLKYAE